MSACRRRDGKPKVAHESELLALNHVGPGENAYQCRRCAMWHVGHSAAHGRPQLEAKYARARARQARRRGAWA